MKAAECCLPDKRARMLAMARRLSDQLTTFIEQLTDCALTEEDPTGTRPSPTARSPAKPKPNNSRFQSGNDGRFQS